MQISQNEKLSISHITSWKHLKWNVAVTQGRPLNVKLGTRCTMGEVRGKQNEENKGEAKILL